MLDRVIGVVTLDDPTYRAVKRDPAATRQALLLIGLTTLLGTVARFDDPLPWQIVAPLLVVAGWFLSAWLTVRIGTRLLGAPDGDAAELFRLLGYTSVTGIGSALRPLPIIGPLLNYPLMAWGLVLEVKATKVGLEFRTGRAIATYLLAELLGTALFLSVYLLFRFRDWA
jgi:hypothetical protein